MPLASLKLNQMFKTNDENKNYSITEFFQTKSHGPFPLSSLAHVEIYRRQLDWVPMFIVSTVRY